MPSKCPRCVARAVVPQNHSIAFADQVVNLVMSVRKCHAELPFETLKLITVHRRGTQMTEVVRGDELVKGTSKASV